MTEQLPLPDITTTHSPQQVLAILTAAAKQAKLPGFSLPKGRAAKAGAAFTAEAFGTIFEHELRAFIQKPEIAGEPGKIGVASSEFLIHFSVHLLPKKPLIIAACMLVSIWPGLPMTDAMIRSWWAWYDGLPTWATTAWYLPLCALPLPWIWYRWNRDSRASAYSHALEQIEKIRQLLRLVSD